MIKTKKIREENKKLSILYERYAKGAIKTPTGLIDFNLYAEGVLKAVNSTLAWCAQKTDKAPSEWLEPSLTLWIEKSRRATQKK